MIEHTSFLYWITHPVTIFSLVIYGWMAFAFGKAYRKIERKRYLIDGFKYLFILPFQYFLYIILGSVVISISLGTHIYVALSLLTTTNYDKRYFEYVSIRSIMLFRDPDNVQLPPEIGVHPEKGLFVPHAPPTQQIYIKQGVFLLIGVVFVIAISVLYFR